MVVQEGHAPEGSERVRLNPPAYSPYASSPGPADPMPQSPGRRELTPCHRTCREKASVDTQQSSDSGTTHGGGESVSSTGIDEVIGRMGLLMRPESFVGSTMGAHIV
jgi:hypothetical protein